MSEHCYEPSEDLVIDLADLFFFLLKKWRKLLLLLLVGAILGALVGGGKLAAGTQPSVEELEALEKAMPELEQARRYRQIYEQIVDYQEKSPTMHMDPNSVYVGKVVYSIQADSQLDAIIAQYTGMLDDALSHRLLEASGMEFEVQYISELVSCWSYSQNRENSTTEELTSKVDCMAYQVQSSSRESCDAMLDVIRTAVEALDAELHQTYSGYSAQKISNTILHADPNSYISHQEGQASRLNSSRSNMQNLESKFTGYTATYYFQEMLGQEPEEDSSSPAKTILKWAIVGAFLAGVCWGGWYLIVYLASDTVKTPGEISETYRVPLLGRLSLAQVPAHPLDRLIFRLRPAKAAEEPAFIASVIGAMVPGEIALCAETSGQDARQTLLACSPQLVPLPYPAGDAQALDTLRQLGSAVLVVCPGKTRREDVRQQLKLCALQKIQVLGIVSAEV